MSHIFQRIRQFNSAELHPYPSQYNPFQIVPSVGGMLFALPVGGDNIWPIGRGIPWGNQGKDATLGAEWMCGLNNPFPAPGADAAHRWFGLRPTSLLLTEEAPWKKDSHFGCSSLSTWKYKFSYNHWRQVTLSSVSIWMGDWLFKGCLSVADNP